MATATATQPKVLPAKARAMEGIRFARSMTRDLLKDFPQDKATYQACGTDNHIIWNLGHLASTYQWVASLLDGKPVALPARYDEMFGGKSKPVSDSTQYPPLADVRRVYDESFDRFIAAFEATDESDLDKPPLGEGYGFIKDRMDAAFKAAWHEGWHAGQISSIRRALNLPRLMG